MGSSEHQLFYVFMNYDPEYERLLSNRSEEGEEELHSYLSKKHDELLAATLEGSGSYRKKVSLAVIDGFAVEITEDQANILRSADQVRLVEKNQELS